MSLTCEFGYRKFGQFRTVLKCDQDSLVYKGKSYSWSSIVKFKRYDSAFYNYLFWQGGTPLLYIYLNDGKIIRLRGGRLRKNGDDRSASFLGSTTPAYDYLVGLLEERCGKVPIS
jgi:hypothetical protein